MARSRHPSREAARRGGRKAARMMKRGRNGKFLRKRR